MNSLKDSTLDNLFNLIDFNKIFLILVSLLVIVLIVRLLEKFSAKITENFSSKRLLILQITTIIVFLLYTLGTFFIIYNILAPPKELLIALGASVAVAVGFALKDIASSIIAGFILLFDKPFQVGDRVTYDNHYGEVVSIGLRTVRLNTLDDNLITIPNAKFLTDAVASGNSGNLHMMITMDFHVAIDSDLDQAVEIITEVVTNSRFAYLINPVNVVLSEVEICHNLAIKMTAKAYVLDVKYEKAFQSDIVSRVTKSFNKHQVKRPEFKGFSSEK